MTIRGILTCMIWGCEDYEIIDNKKVEVVSKQNKDSERIIIARIRCLRCGETQKVWANDNFNKV